MVKQLGDRLPKFTEEERELITGSNDFYGMNHYCANYIKNKDTAPDPEDVGGNLEVLFEDKNGNSIGPLTQSPWLRPHAPGFRKLMKWLSDRYGGPKIYVTENGTSIKERMTCRWMRSSKMISGSSTSGPTSRRWPRPLRKIVSIARDTWHGV